ncbi:hypothetical protein ACFLZX_04050 [Nanoarchaeota archaeon]
MSHEYKTKNTVVECKDCGSLDIFNEPSNGVPNTFFRLSQQDYEAAKKDTKVRFEKSEKGCSSNGGRCKVEDLTLEELYAVKHVDEGPKNYNGIIYRTAGELNVIIRMQEGFTSIREGDSGLDPTRSEVNTCVECGAIGLFGDYKIGASGVFSGIPDNLYKLSDTDMMIVLHDENVKLRGVYHPNGCTPPISPLENECHPRNISLGEFYAALHRVSPVLQLATDKEHEFRERSEVLESRGKRSVHIPVYSRLNRLSPEDMERVVREISGNYNKLGAPVIIDGHFEHRGESWLGIEVAESVRDLGGVPERHIGLTSLDFEGLRNRGNGFVCFPKGREMHSEERISRWLDSLNSLRA